MSDPTLAPSPQRPDPMGRYGPFGGRFVPETLMPCLMELERAWLDVKDDPEFQRELDYWLGDYPGRPSKLYKAERLAAALNPAVTIYLKREDMLHTGAHKINNALGQALLARRLGKRRIIAETGAGQHGVATATACALLGIECEVYMGVEDMERQRLNVARMRLLGAKVTPVTSGSQTLKDATNEAMRDWMASVDTTHYIIGSVVGPHPFPMLVRDFQTVIGREARAQALEREGRLPDLLVACVGGGSNSIGLFHPFYADAGVRFHGVEAGGLGLASGQHCMSLMAGELGVFHGSRSYVLQDGDGQIQTTHSISAGLDYPGVGPEHAFYRDSGRAEYFSITDAEALEGVRLLAQTEGIIPALETAHAIAHLSKIAPAETPGAIIIICLSGRGDKDMETIVRELGL